MKSVLVTGGAGFIGSHLCDKLIQQGYQVICMDNLITGKKENISHFLNNPHFKFVQHDVSKYIDIKDDLDCILHFASPASPIDYQLYPIQTLKVGSLGTHNTLGLAKGKRAKYLLASTSEIYGDPLVNPQREDYWGNVNCVGPRGVYDEAKRFAEAITLAYHRTHDIDAKIARIFNTYGPRMRKDDGRAVPNFITQALNHLPLSVYGDGLQTRSFCYIDDMVEGICRLMLSKSHEPVNLGNPHQTSILELTNLVIKLAKSRSTITFRPLPEDDPKLRCPDISRAEELLDWQPSTGLLEGLAKTIEWFKRQKEKEDV